MLSKSLRPAWQFCGGLAACLLLLLIIEPRLIEKFLPGLQIAPRSAPGTDHLARRPVIYPPESLFAHSATLSPAAADDWSAMPIESFCRPPPDYEGLAAIQHTATGRIRLGQSFFQRLLKSNVAQYLVPDVQKWILWRNQAARPGLDREPDPFVVTDAAWSEMASWWNRTVHTSIDGNEWYPAKKRFEALAAKPLRSSEEERELWQIVVTCGHTWLKVPYDPQTERFDLDADLPDDAPETAARYYRRMYHALTGYEYGQEPPSGFRTGGDIGTVIPDSDGLMPPARP